MTLSCASTHSFPRLAAGLLLAALTFPLAAGCEASADPDHRIWFQPLEHRRPASASLNPLPPPASQDEIKGFREIFSGVEAAPAALFSRDNIDRWADQIEGIYLRSGRYLELIGIYQRAVDQLGVDSKAGPRLAWTYVRLGQRHLAGPLLDELERLRPDDPSVHFVRGAYHFNRGGLSGGSRQAMARAILAWEQTLSLDEDFSGFGPFESQSLRDQINRLEQQLDADPADLVDN